MKSHHDLDVWRTSITLARRVYQTTRLFPKDELYGLTGQMRRASVSIASNIAEGAARRSTREFIQFLYVASGSANELDTQIEIAKEVELGERSSMESLQEDTTRVLKMLRGLIRSLRAPSEDAI